MDNISKGNNWTLGQSKSLPKTNKKSKRSRIIINTSSEIVSLNKARETLLKLYNKRPKKELYEVIIELEGTEKKLCEINETIN